MNLFWLLTATWQITPKYHDFRQQPDVYHLLQLRCIRFLHIAQWKCLVSASWLLELPLVRFRVIQQQYMQYPPSSSGAVHYNTNGSTSKWLPEVPHSLLAGFQRQMSQDTQQIALFLGYCLGILTAPLPSSSQIPLDSKGSNIDSTAPFLPMETVSSRMGAITTVNWCHYP